MYSQEEFNKVWKDSSREDILNQFYYEHKELVRVKKEIGEYATQHMMEVAKIKGINGEENGAIYVAVADLLEILDKEKE